MLWSDESFVHRDPAVNWPPLTYLTCLIAETHCFSYQHHKCSTWKIHFLQERKKHHQILEFYTFYTLIPGRTIAAFMFPMSKFRNILSGASSSICSICFLPQSQCVWFAISSSMWWCFCCIFWYIHERMDMGTTKNYIKVIWWSSVESVGAQSKLHVAFVGAYPPLSSLCHDEISPSICVEIAIFPQPD